MNSTLVFPRKFRFQDASRIPIELAKRFVEKIEFGQDCWRWLGAKHRSGHGSFRFYGRPHPAHRVSYELFIGPVLAGLDVDHLCRNTNCVNPDHLEPVKPGENLRRALVARTHCRRGHPFVNGNLVITKRGEKVERACRECHKKAQDKINAIWNPIYEQRRKDARKQV